MEWMIVIGFILGGLLLILIEIFFVPGTTVVGVAGFLLAGYGVYLSYDYFDNTTGNWILAGSVVVTLFLIRVAFKSESWDRFSLHDSLTGKVNDDYRHEWLVGEEGESVSSLRPVGKAIFQDKEIEVRTNGDYIRENQPIRIIKIIDNKIYVEPIK